MKIMDSSSHDIASSRHQQQLPMLGMNKTTADPCLHTCRLRKDDKVASERVQNELKNIVTRFRLKMNVSYTDHPHIIGKGGFTVKQIITSTGCHIHFPDSNRSNITEKSNQVSIVGTLQGIEKARANIRRSMPLIFSFRLSQPVTNGCDLLLLPLPTANNHPIVRQVGRQHNVEIKIRSSCENTSSTVVIIKGCEWEAESVKQATMRLVKYFYGESQASNICIEMSMEISPQHHGLVAGRNNVYLKNIMQQTGTCIMFPDLDDPDVPCLKKSNILILGNIHHVYQARQQLIGCLPLMVMFELPASIINSDFEDVVGQLSRSLRIGIKAQRNKNIVSVFIKGIERHAGTVYAVCKQLAKLDGPPTEVDIPESYLTPMSAASYGRESKITDSEFDFLAVSPRRRRTVSKKNPEDVLRNVASNSCIACVQKHTMAWITHHQAPDLSYGSRFATNTPMDLSLQRDNNLADVLSKQILADRRAPGCERSIFEKLSHNYKTKIFQDLQRDYMELHTAQQWPGEVAVQESYFAPDNFVPLGTKCINGNQRYLRFSPCTSTLNCSLAVHGPSTYLNHATLGPLQDKDITYLGTSTQHLASLLIQQGLGDYVNLFAVHEIDLQTFTSLTDNELQSLGVYKFGHRRKMTQIITELHEREWLQMGLRQLQDDNPACSRI